MSAISSTYSYLMNILRFFFPKSFIIFTVYLMLLVSVIIIIIYLTLQTSYYLIYKFGKNNSLDYPLIRDKRVSVIIPVKSEPIEIIEKAVRRVLEQNYPMHLIELIIVSDDSKEKAHVLERDLRRIVSGSGIKFIFVNRSFPIGGKAGALNEALKHVTGEFVFLLDADAEIERNYLAGMISFMERNNYAAAVSDINPKNTYENDLCETQAISWNFLKKTLFIGRQKAGFSIPFVGTCSAIRTNVLKRIGGWDEKIIIDDLPLTIKLLSNGYRIGYASNVKSYIEVPKTYKSFKSQQKRWAYGGLKTAINYFKDLVSAKIPVRLKIDMLLYLIQYQITMINLLFIVAAVSSIIFSVDLLFLPPIISIIWNISLVAYALCYLDSIREENYSAFKAIINLGRGSALLISLIPTFFSASFKVFLGKSIEWKVTPKGKRAFTHRGTAVIESLIGQILLIGFFYSIMLRLYFASIAFLVFGIPFIYTSLKTIFMKW